MSRHFVDRVLVAAFGLIHGAGFARVLDQAARPDKPHLGDLLGFNLGVELGQLVIVLAGALVLRVLPGDRSGPARSGEETVPDAWLAPRWLRLGVSGSVAVLGALWFGERAGWLG